MTNKLSHSQAIGLEKRMYLVVSNGLYRLLAHGSVRVQTPSLLAKTLIATTVFVFDIFFW